MSARVFLKRNYYRIVYPFRKAYWFFFRPSKNGAQCLVQCEEKFLLIRVTYANKKWTIPGGGLDKNETFEAAAIRETKEEVGISLKTVQKIGEYDVKIGYRPIHVKVFHSRVADPSFAIDPVEIQEAQWFRTENLPKNLYPHVKEIFAMLAESGIQ